MTDEYCEECGRTPCCFSDPDPIGDDPNGGWTAEQIEIDFKPKVRLIGVVAFTVGLANKSYGGQEEGGWWYDTFTPERVLYAPSRRADSLRKRLERLADHWNKQEKRYPPSSVACTGYWTVIQDAITEDEPKERPYYS